MRFLEGVIATTHVDRQGEQLTRDALVNMAEAIGRAYVPMGVEHDPRRAPIGRIASAEVREREDGESEVVANFELFEDDDDALGDGREIVLQSYDETPTISFDWTYRDSEDQQDIDVIAEALGSEPIYEGKKSADPISVITIVLAFVAGGVGAGFFNQVGADGWELTKRALVRLFGRKDKRSGEQLLKLTCLREVNGRTVEVVLIQTNPTSTEVADFFQKGLIKLDAALPAYEFSHPDIRRLTFEYRQDEVRLLFGVTKDCYPWLPVLTSAAPNRTIRFSLFKDSRYSFLKALSDENIEYVVPPPLANVVVASGATVEIVQTIATSTSIAAVLVAWIRARSSRKIIVTKSNNEVVHLEGYSVKDVEKLLPLISSGAAIDTEPEDSK